MAINQWHYGGTGTMSYARLGFVGDIIPVSPGSTRNPFSTPFPPYSLGSIWLFGSGKTAGRSQTEWGPWNRLQTTPQASRNLLILHYLGKAGQGRGASRPNGYTFTLSVPAVG